MIDKPSNFIELMGNFVESGMLDLPTAQAVFDNYDERKIEKTKVEDYVLSTAWVLDGKCFETAVSHLYFCSPDKSWCVLEKYDSREEAEDGHKKWKLCFELKLTEPLQDIWTDEVFEWHEKSPTARII